jgi:hypothetical protein
MIGKHLSYEELGREADLAIRHHATAKQAVVEMRTPQALASKVEVQIKGASWDNGLLYLQAFISEVVREQLASIVPAALDRMEAAALAKTEALRQVFAERGGQTVEPVRQVPREIASGSATLGDRAAPAAAPALDGEAFARQTAPAERFAGRDPMSGYGTGYASDPRPTVPAPGSPIDTGLPSATLNAEQRTEHEQSVAQTPPAGSAEAAGTAAPSGPAVGSTPTRRGRDDLARSARGGAIRQYRPQARDRPRPQRDARQATRPQARRG